jgi:hypothetical protein
MANRPFEYRVINPLERPKSEDLNIAQGQSHYDVRLFAYEIFGRQNGFLGYSFNPEPTAPVSLAVAIQQGVAFQYGDEELAIGSIPGLNDVYRQKAVTMSNRSIAVTAAPTGAGDKRYDLIQIRALSGSSERLTDQVTTDILDPELQSFTETPKFKTLTSSLTPFDPVYTVEGATVTAPISYVTGNAGVYASWNDVPKPAVATGYLGVAYIKREYGQTSITSADIEDARTLLKLPVMVGGTNNTEIAPAGYVAYSDGTKLNFTQALGGLSYSPQTGWLLASTDGGEPSWIEPAVASSLLVSAGANANPTWLTPGASGATIVSNGTSWQSQSLVDFLTRHYSSVITGGIYSNNTTSYTEIPGLKLEDIALRLGNVRIEICPAESATTDYNARLQNLAGGRRGYIRLTLEKGPITIDRVFTYELDPNTTGYIALPSVTELITDAGDWTVTVSGRVYDTNSTIFVQNCELVVSQG